MTIENFAEKVYLRMNTKPGERIPVFVDPATLMMIMTIISGVIKALQECRKNRQEAVKVAYNPGPVEKRVLKRQIRKNLGWRKSLTEGNKYYNAILAEGLEITPQDMDNAYNEIEQ